MAHADSEIGGLGRPAVSGEHAHGGREADPQTILKMDATTLAESILGTQPPVLVRSPKPIPLLSPAPAFLEEHRRPKDDAFVALPETPKRPGLGQRGMSLQLSMPQHDSNDSVTPGSSPYKPQRAPLSPKPEGAAAAASYSPGSVLPRRSRGLDYTRACTSLHHSTLAEQSSPDSSPVIGAKGTNIPRRGHSGNSGPASPMFASSHWSTSSNADSKTMVSGSLGSVNMLGSGSDSSSSDDEMVADEDDTIHVTPQPFRHSNIFGITTGTGASIDTMNPYQQAAASLMSFQRRTRRKRSTRHSSSSASGRSSLASPIPGSPPIHKAIDGGGPSGYFDKELRSRRVESRRESLSLGTGELHISDSLDEDSAGQRRSSEMISSANVEERRNVIRRAVTRRSNMLPKPKMLARIQAALQEEGSPVDTECRREAEVIRQVKESDHSPDSTAVATQPPTTVSSPSLQPSQTNNSDVIDDLAELTDTLSEQRESESFSKKALRNSVGSDFWTQFDSRLSTPPPPPLFGRGSSSGISEDVNMDTPASSMSLSQFATRNSSPSRSITPQPATSSGESSRFALGKRRRDDDLDIHLYKRRAVSPGVSHQNSPVLPPSPAQRDGPLWATKGSNERSGGSSGGGAGLAGSVGKRIGLQGMSDTNDGIMNMSIE